MPSYTRSRLLTAREFAIAELANIRSEDPVFKTEVLDTLRDIVPFDHYMFSGLDLEGARAGRGIVLATDFPAELVSEYHAQDLFATDPLFNLVTAEAPDVSWHDLDKSTLRALRVQPLVRLLERYAVSPRTAFSFWNGNGAFYGVAVFTSVTPFSPSQRTLLHWLAKQLHSALSDPFFKAFNAQVGLSSREIECLEMASRGQTSEDIASALGIATESVNSHIKMAGKKLRAKNRVATVADAIRLGLMS